MATYTYTDSFSVGGVGVNGATVNAYRASRFSGVPALNASAPGSADATTTTGSTAGFNGSFAIALPTFEDYYISVTYLANTYWKGPVSQPFADGTGALGGSASAGTLGITSDIVVVGGAAALQQTNNVAAVTQTNAWQNVPRRGGNVGAATGSLPSTSFPYGQVEFVLGDSIATDFGASVHTRSWQYLLSQWENRSIGVADPHPVGFWPASLFSAVGANLTTVQGLGIRSTDRFGVQLAGTLNSNTAPNSLTDNNTFSRAVIFYAPQAGSDAIAVSVSGQGGATSHTIDGTGIATGGNSTVAFYDTGQLTPTATTALSLWRVTKLSGAGGTAPIILGVRYYGVGLTTTAGLTVEALAQGGLGTNDFVLNRGWESYLGAISSQVRRVHIRLGGNDIILARSVTDAAFNNSTTLTSATAVFVTGDVGRPVTGNANIPANTVISAWVSATQVTLNNATTGGSLTAQSVSFGQIPAATTGTNLATVISRVRAQAPLAEIALFGEYQPCSTGLSQAGGFMPVSTYASTAVPMYQSTAFNNNCTYVDMFSRFGSVANTQPTDVGLTSGQPTITSTQAQFSQGDVGMVVGQPTFGYAAIPAGTTILSVQSATSATMSANATASLTAGALAITAMSGSGTVVTVTCANAFATGNIVRMTGLAGGFGGMNSTAFAIASASSTQFTITNATTGATTTGTATPQIVFNRDVYGLTFDGGLHFGDSTNSAGKVDGQRAHANEVWERLGYGSDVAQPPTAVVAITATGTWVCPTTGSWQITAVGGGGGGAAGSTCSSAITQAGSGGGGQGESKTMIQTLTAGVAYACTIGAGGTGGGAGVATVAGGTKGGVGSPGGTTTFAAGVSVSVLGGCGGNSATASSTTVSGGGGCYAVGGAFYAGGTATSGAPIHAGEGGYGSAPGALASAAAGGGAIGSSHGGGGGSGGASSTLGGGGGGGAGPSGPGAAGANNVSGTANGVNGVNAAAFTFGGGGGAGGAGATATGTGGFGGNGVGGVIYLLRIG